MMDQGWPTFLDLVWPVLWDPWRPSWPWPWDQFLNWPSFWDPCQTSWDRRLLQQLLLRLQLQRLLHRKKILDQQVWDQFPFLSELLDQVRLTSWGLDPTFLDQEACLEVWLLKPKKKTFLNFCWLLEQTLDQFHKLPMFWHPIQPAFWDPNQTFLDQILPKRTFWDPIHRRQLF